MWKIKHKSDAETRISSTAVSSEAAAPNTKWKPSAGYARNDRATEKNGKMFEFRNKKKSETFYSVIPHAVRRRSLTGHDNGHNNNGTVIKKDWKKLWTLFFRACISQSRPH